MVNSKNFSIKQVVDSDEIVSLGSKLKNALGMEEIAKRYLNSGCELIAVFQGSQIKYMLEVRDKTIVQFKGINNCEPSDEDSNEVKDCLIQAGLVHKADF